VRINIRYVQLDLGRMLIIIFLFIGTVFNYFLTAVRTRSYHMKINSINLSTQKSKAPRWS